MKKVSNQTKNWIIITTALTILLVIGEFISDNLISHSSVSPSSSGSFAGFIALMSVVCFSACIASIVKIKGKLKILPIFYIFVSVVIFGLAFFAASFSGYGSY